MSLPPWPLRAMVLSHDPENDGIVVMLASGQMPAFTVRRLYFGAADSHRIDKPPLPGRGTWGLVVFPSGDIRNATWLGAYQPEQIDAIPNSQADPFSIYQSHFSGHWSYTDGLSGYVSQQWADGSYFVASSGDTLQTVFRHIVDPQQNRQQVPFTFSDRNPNPQPTFAFTFAQSGTHFSVALNASGSLLFNFAHGQSVTFAQSGSNSTITMDGSGNITIKGMNTVTIECS